MQKLSEENIYLIRLKFNTLNSIEEVATLINDVYALLFPNAKPLPKTKKPFHITVTSLNYLAYSEHFRQKRYKVFQITKKKKGEFREISAPTYTLKAVQRCLNAVFFCLFEPYKANELPENQQHLTGKKIFPHKAAKGFLPNRSIVDNAKLHVGKRFVYNIDLEGFFPNTSFARVRQVLKLAPFNLKNERDDLGKLITALCCQDDCLPQGAPTSPTLTNMVCQRLDRKLYKLAKENHANYTRYADDITFSSDRTIFNEQLKEAIEKTINEEGYKINKAKERLQGKGIHQEVTGIVVNKKLNVTRRYIRDLYFWFSHWEKDGYASTKAHFDLKYVNQKGYLRYKGKIPPMENVLWGKIQFLGMVRGKTDKLYQKFLEKWKVCQKGNMENSDTDLWEFLQIWENNGLDKAIELYQQKKDTDPENERPLSPEGLF